MPKRKQDPVSEASDNDYDEEQEAPLKPAPSFNGALKKYTFTSSTPSPSRALFASARATKPITPSSRKPAPSPRKRTIPPTTAPAPASPNPKPKKKRPKHPGYAPPQKYAHLSGIPDVLSTNLICVFVGTNPGLKTAATGHAYSAPSNLFWKLLHRSGLTPDQKRPATDDLKLPELYSFGNTNLVSRPTKDQAELSLQEMDASVPVLEGKVRRWKPEAVCIVGKGIWERIYKVKAGKRLKDFVFGWQEGWRFGGVEGEWEGARVFVAVSTSGLVAGYSTERKLEIMTELAEWVNQRRRERGETAPRGLSDEVVEKAAREREEEYRSKVVEWEAWIKVEKLEEEGVGEEELEKEGVEIVKGEDLEKRNNGCPC